MEAEGLLSHTQAKKLIAIVRSVPREQALAVGQERAYALIALSSATPEPDSAAELIAHRVLDGQPAAKASVRAIEAAAKGERAKAPKTAAAKAKAKADAAVEKTVRAMLRASGLKATTVSVGRDEVRVVVPRTQMDKPLEAMQGHTLSPRGLDVWPRRRSYPVRAHPRSLPVLSGSARSALPSRA